MDLRGFIVNATTPFEWKVKPTEIKLSGDMLDKVKAKWADYGMQ
jgi:hypothetical protein